MLRVKARKFSQNANPGRRILTAAHAGREQRCFLFFPIEALGLVESLVLSKESS